MNTHLPNSEQPNSLEGRWAVVTGGSSGVGRATAVRLAQAGAHVWVHCRRNRAGAESVCEQIEGLGRRSRYTLGDLADPATVDSLLDQAGSWGADGPDIWVNNAGADVLTGDAAEWTFEEKLQTLWSVDVLSCIRLSRGIGMAMKRTAIQRDEPAQRVIINTGWDQAAHGMEGDSGEMFGTIKGAVMAFTRSLAKSLAPHVRVHCVAPGWIRTAWGEEASDYWQRRAQRESLLQRWGEPGDVANATCFLASPEAAFLTAVTLPINGGFRTASDSPQDK